MPSKPLYGLFAMNPWEHTLKTRIWNSNFVQSLLDYAESRFRRILMVIQSGEPDARRTRWKYLAVELQYVLGVAGMALIFGWDIHVDIIVRSVAEAYTTLAIENDCFLHTSMLDLLDALPPNNSPSALVDDYLNDWWNDPELPPFIDHIPAAVYSRLLNDTTAVPYIAFHNEQRAKMSMPEPVWEVPPTKATYTWSRDSLPLPGQVNVDECRKCLGYRSIALSSFEQLMGIKTHIDGMKVIHEQHFNRSLRRAGAFHELFIAGLRKEEEVAATSTTATHPELQSLPDVPLPEHFREAGPQVQWTFGKSLTAADLPKVFGYGPESSAIHYGSDGLPGLSRPSSTGVADSNGGNGATNQRVAAASPSTPSGTTQTAHNSPPTSTPDITPAVNIVNALSARLDAGDTASPTQGLPSEPDVIAPDMIDFSGSETNSEHGCNGRSEDNDSDDNMPDVVDFSDGESDSQGVRSRSHNMRNPSFGLVETASSPTSNQGLARDLEDTVPDIVDISDDHMAIDGPTSDNVDPEEVSSDNSINPDVIELSDGDESPQLMRVPLTDLGPDAPDIIEISSSDEEESADEHISLDPDMVDFSDSESSEGQHDYSSARFDPDTVQFSDGEMEEESERRPYVPPAGPYTAAAFANIDPSMLHLEDSE